MTTRIRRSPGAVPRRITALTAVLALATRGAHKTAGAPVARATIKPACAGTTQAQINRRH
jgi:hypothetical protein